MSFKPVTNDNHTEEVCSMETNARNGPRIGSSSTVDESLGQDVLPLARPKTTTRLCSGSLTIDEKNSTVMHFESRTNDKPRNKKVYGEDEKNHANTVVSLIEEHEE